MKKKSFKGSTMLNPVPVVLISTKNRKGESNVFTVAWTGIICTEPPMLYISVRPDRLSYEYLKDTMEFTVNMPTKSMVKSLDYCGVRTGRKNNKIKECNFTMKKSSKIKSDYIDECPINMECKVKEIVKLNGTHDMFLATILESHIAENIIDDNEKIHFDWADLLVYSHGEYFSLNKKRLGSFGFSVAKGKTIIRNSKKVMEKPSRLKMGIKKSEENVRSKNKNDNFSKSNKKTKFESPKKSEKIGKLLKDDNKRSFRKKKIK